MFKKILFFVSFLITINKCLSVTVVPYMDCPHQASQQCALMIKDTPSSEGAFSFIHIQDLSQLSQQLGNFFFIDPQNLKPEKNDTFFIKVPTQSASKIMLAIENHRQQYGLTTQSLILVPLPLLKNKTFHLNDERLYSQNAPSFSSADDAARFLEENLHQFQSLQNTPTALDISKKGKLIEQLGGNRDLFLDATKHATGQNYAPNEKGVLKLVPEVSNPEKTPFTASEASLYLLMRDLIQTNPQKYSSDYLEKSSPEQRLEDFLNDFAQEGVNELRDPNQYTIPESIKKLVPTVLKVEQENKKRYVAYHAMFNHTAFYMDLISALRSKLTGKKIINAGGVWDTSFDTSNNHSLQSYIDKSFAEAQKNYARYEKAYSSRTTGVIVALGLAFQYNEAIGSILAANLGLFNNNNSPLEYSFGYWVKSFYAYTPIKTTDLSPMLDSLGIPFQEASALITKTWDKIKDQSTGRLVQFFIHPAIIDQIAYISNGNKPLQKEILEQRLVQEDYLPSKVLFDLRENPLAFESTLKNSVLDALQTEEHDEEGKLKAKTRPLSNWMQLRILPLSEIFYKKGNVETHIYPSKEIDQTLYNAEIETLATSLLKLMDESGPRDFKFHGKTNVPSYTKNKPLKPSLRMIKEWIQTKNQDALKDYLSKNSQEIDLIIEGKSLFQWLFEHRLYEPLYVYLTIKPWNDMPRENQSLLERKLSSIENFSPEEEKFLTIVWNLVKENDLSKAIQAIRSMMYSDSENNDQIKTWAFANLMDLLNTKDSPQLRKEVLRTANTEIYDFVLAHKPEIISEDFSFFMSVFLNTSPSRTIKNEIEKLRLFLKHLSDFLEKNDVDDSKISVHAKTQPLEGKEQAFRDFSKTLDASKYENTINAIEKRFKKRENPFF